MTYHTRLGGKLGSRLPASAKTALTTAGVTGGINSLLRIAHSRIDRDSLQPLKKAFSRIGLLPDQNVL